MTKSRLEAFSDGVIAIIITIMVLEMKAPHSAEFSALGPIIPIFFSYVLSFIYVAIYWSNHHHLFQLVKHVSGRVMWANTHLLFWLSLIPFATAWSGENHFAPVPVALYGVVLFMAAVAYFILSHTLTTLHGKDSHIAQAVGWDFKGVASAVLYAAAIGIAFVETELSLLIFVIVAALWVIPDKRIEKVLKTLE